jgi:hypothetical protein
MTYPHIFCNITNSTIGNTLGSKNISQMIPKWFEMIPKWSHVVRMNIFMPQGTDCAVLKCSIACDIAII